MRAAYVGDVGWAFDDGNCSGGRMGDLDRVRAAGSLERLCDRPRRMRPAMALKNDSSVGDAACLWLKGDVGEAASEVGDMAGDDSDLLEWEVPVRRTRGWKWAWVWDDIVGWLER